MKLLPHIYNRIAIDWLIIWLIANPICLKVFGVHLGRSIYPFMGIINTIVLLLACFSSEKVEDERVRQFRLRSVAIVALIAFAVDIVGYASFLLGWSSLSDSIESYQTDFALWVLMYILIFKAFVLVDMRRANNEE